MTSSQALRRLRAAFGPIEVGDPDRQAASQALDDLLASCW